jgi:hypothetical protein
MQARSITAITTLLVVMLTTLWPLVSAVHASLAAEEAMLCHQARDAVMPGEAPRKGEDAPAGGKQHCPLCLMPFYGAAMRAPQPPRPTFHFVVAHVPEHSSAAPIDSQFDPALSRAPPGLPA